LVRRLITFFRAITMFCGIGSILHNNLSECEEYSIGLTILGRTFLIFNLNVTVRNFPPD
jgi:hypothetical protein